MRRPPKYAVVAALACLGGTLSGCTSSTTGPSSPASTTSSSTPSATASPVGSPSPRPSPAPTTSAPTRSPASHPTSTPVARAACLRMVTIGYSVRHRAITACERGTPGGVALVVVGNIHGDERIGWRVVDQLMTASVPAGVDLWLVRSVNPDGSAVGTRVNAHGVDENRNFPAQWAATAPGSTTYGGPRPLSEPETAALAAWLLRLKPRTVVVIHSPLDAVDFSDGPIRP